MKSLVNGIAMTILFLAIMQRVILAAVCQMELTIMYLLK